jgi:hypothetical protein
MGSVGGGRSEQPELGGGRRLGRFLQYPRGRRWAAGAGVAHLQSSIVADGGGRRELGVARPDSRAPSLAEFGAAGSGAGQTGKFRPRAVQPPYPNALARF